MKADIRELTYKITDWCNSVYPERTPALVLAKLLEEIEELQERPSDGHELADVMILLLDLCDLAGVDIVKAVHWKMIINENRSWIVDENGKLQNTGSVESKPREALAYCGYCEDPIAGGTPVECLHDIGRPCKIDGGRVKREV